MDTVSNNKLWLAYKASRKIGWLLTRFLVAAILIVAVCLKSYQLNTSSSLGNGFFDLRWFQITLIECELVLALVLFFGFRHKISWFVTTALFAVFGIVLLYKGISGAESCGCLGSLNVNPFLMFGIDVVIVGLLLLFRPINELLPDDSVRNVLKKNWFAQTLAITFAMILVSTTQIHLFSGSFFELNISESEITFAIDEKSESQQKNIVKILVTNHTSRPFTIIGAKTDCNCGAVEGVPKRIDAYKEEYVSFVTSDKVDKLSKSKEGQTIMFFVDDLGTKRVSVALPIFEYLVRSEKSL
jgi:hypothetical protein